VAWFYAFVSSFLGVVAFVFGCCDIVLGCSGNVRAVVTFFMLLGHHFVFVSSVLFLCHVLAVVASLSGAVASFESFVSLF